MSDRRLSLCIVGSGPRGLSALERMCANAALDPASAVTVHVVDPAPPGAGRVWRCDQSAHLLMNTVASQVTLFTDESVEMDGPLAPGPSLYEWARRLAAPTDGGGGPDPAVGEAEDQLLAEARRLGPDDYPTRAFYGCYLRWVFEAVVGCAPANVHVVVHRTRVVAVDDQGPGQGGAQRVAMEDGTVLTGLDAVVMAVGHVDTAEHSDAEAFHREAVAAGLTRLPPANPADADLDAIASGEPVILRGLGLNFFDYLALFTHGRGGRFTEDGDRLVYHPSGREPHLYAGSRRGIPYHARGDNQKGPHGRHVPLLLTPETVAALRARGQARQGLDFTRDIWPLAAKEVETVYYTALLARERDEQQVAAFRQAFLAVPRGSADESDLLKEYGVSPGQWWDWEDLARPYAGEHFTGPEDFRRWLVRLLRTDVAEARAGNVLGPRKAALDTMRDLRNEIRLLVDHGGLTAASHEQALDRWYTPLNAFLSIGPPTRRVQEMLAVMEAGLLDLVGPGMRVGIRPDGAAFVASSTRVPGSQAQARVLIEARLPDIDLRRTADPLLRHLTATGQGSLYVVHGPGGTRYRTGGLAVGQRPYHLIDAAGREHPRRFAFGVPTESVHWVTAAGIRPGVNSVTLGDSDAIARAVLALADVRHPSLGRTDVSARAA